MNANPKLRCEDEAGSGGFAMGGGELITSMVVADTQVNLTVKESKFIDVSLVVYKNDDVEEQNFQLLIGEGTKSHGLAELEGSYEAIIIDSSGIEAWNFKFEMYYDFYGPMWEDEDYSDIDFESQLFTYRVPFLEGMRRFELQHNGNVIYSKDFDYDVETKVPEIGTTGTIDQSLIIFSAIFVAALIGAFYFFSKKSKKK